MIKSPYKVIILSMIVALLFWVLDAYVDSVYHYDKAFISLLFPNEKELYFRLLYSTGILLFGIIMSLVVASTNRAENKLLEEKTKTDAILATLGDGISIQDPDYRVLYQNETHKAFVGSHEGEFCYKVYEKRDHVCEGCPVAMAFRDGKSHKAERSITTEEGIAYFEIIASPLTDSTGAIYACIESARDVTERKHMETQIRASLKEKEVLLQEIHHRVKNNMTIIHSLLYMQANKVNDERYRELLNESINRIKTMSLIHEKLYQSKDLTKIDFNDYLTDIANNIAASYVIDRDNISVLIDIQNIDLVVDDAISCGLIVNELLSNAMKHAFPNNREGNIALSMQINDQNEVELKVADNGIGMPDDLDSRKAASLGLNLVDALVSQLQGEIIMQAGQGSCFIITFKR